VLAALQRNHAAQHGEPQKQDGGKFVRPDQRRAERVARGDAGKQDTDLCNHQDGGRDFGHKPQRSVEPVHESGGAGEHGMAGHVGERR